MAELQVNATRMELKKLRERLKTSRHGHKLLKDKRDEMIRRFMDTVKGARELRGEVEAAAEGINASFSIASAVTSPEVMEESLALPLNEGELTVTHRSIMNVSVPVFSYEGEKRSENSFCYGFAFTSGELDFAVSEAFASLPRMLLLAEKEKTAELLADEIEKTRRRVNALEYVIIPQYEAEIRRIIMRLNENERGNTTRLMKLKDTIVRERIEKRKAEPLF